MSVPFEFALNPCTVDELAFIRRARSLALPRLELQEALLELHSPSATGCG
jgi:hypothetical protein